MKTFQIRIFSMFFILFLAVCCFSQEETTPMDTTARMAEYQTAQEGFDKIVSNVANFFQKKQKMVHKFLHSKSSTSHAVHLVEYTCKEVSYNLESVLSDKSIIDGFITLSATKRNNRSCGNVPDITTLAPPIGWETVGEALAHNKEKCFKTSLKSPKAKFRLYFKFFEGEWQFQDAVGVNNKKPVSELSAAFGKPVDLALKITDESGVKFNQKWLALIQ